MIQLLLSNNVPANSALLTKYWLYSLEQEILSLTINLSLMGSYIHTMFAKLIPLLGKNIWHAIPCDHGKRLNLWIQCIFLRLSFISIVLTDGTSIT